MARGQCCLYTVLFLILVSLGLTLAGIFTDYWYRVDATAVDGLSDELKRNFSYHFGMWRKCYDNGFPPEIPIEDRVGDCMYTFSDLLPRGVYLFDVSRYLHMERSWLGCMIACAGVQLFTILCLICGLWPADCKTIRRSTLYLVGSLLCLIGAMCGIASGICFIALRDLDETSLNLYPTGVQRGYEWSFIIAWVGTGLCLLEGFIFLALLCMDYIDINEKGGKYGAYYSM